MGVPQYPLVPQHLEHPPVISLRDSHPDPSGWAQILLGPWASE